MVALVRALGGFHLAQKRVHLFHGQTAVGAHRAVAGHGGEQLVLRAFDHVAGIVLGQLGQHAAGQLAGVAFGVVARECGGHGAHGQGFGRKRADLQAQLRQRFGVGFCCGHFERRGREGGWNQQRLAGDAFVGRGVHLRFQALVDDAFVRRVHVHDDQALRVFSQDVDALQLREGLAKWPGLAVGGRLHSTGRREVQRRVLSGVG